MDYGIESYWEIVQEKKLRLHLDFPQKPEGRQLVISDIHGCARSLKALIEKVGLSRKDQLFFLGDYINRGPNSLGVIDFIIELMQRGYHVWPLRGNHEEMLLSSHRSSFTASVDAPVKGMKKQQPAVKVPVLNKGKGLLDKDRRIYPQYRAFFECLPYYFELPKHFLVHAGFDFKSILPYENYQKMPWIRPFKASAVQARYKQIVVGHSPTPISVIRKSIEEGSTVLLLDNGCVFRSRPEMGRLLCLDLNTRQLFEQPNID